MQPKRSSTTRKTLPTTITATCGLPGSGKSTWARVAAARQVRPPYVISADAIRERGADGSLVFQAMEMSARRALRAGIDVIVDACALDPKTRMQWLRIAHDVGAQSRLVVFITPTDVCRARDAARPVEQRARADWSEMDRKFALLLERVAIEQWDRVTFLPYHASEGGEHG
jgi:protein phosphatase